MPSPTRRYDVALSRSTPLPGQQFPHRFDEAFRPAGGKAFIQVCGEQLTPQQQTALGVPDERGGGRDIFFAGCGDQVLGKTGDPEQAPINRGVGFVAVQADTWQAESHAVDQSVGIAEGERAEEHVASGEFLNER